ncbi:sodium channel protein Nach-like [Hetaerina americana]|uniref:sodium channel protein Nach-like n=1 Tax=Hetaerina americana TaxID=62018 RepID=UPI003A7F132E
MYLHSPYDVPYANIPLTERASVDWGEGLILEFQVKETENADGVEDLDVSQRRCRFPWEKPDGTILLYQQYSYSTCIVECHAAAQLDMCNCTDHFIPSPAGWNHTCTTEGLACLTKLQGTLRSLRTNWSNKAGLICDCDTGCLEPEYTIVQKSNFRQSTSLNETPMVTVKMSALPSERFRRNIVRTRLDLVVSLGGIAGLFLGASILSAVEILYHAVIISMNFWQRPVKKVNPSTSFRREKKKRKMKTAGPHSSFHM